MTRRANTVFGKFGKYSRILLTALLVSGGTASAADLDADYWRSDLNDAMKLAHRGNYDESLPVLERLHKEYPNEVEITRDYLAVLDWSDHDDQVVKLYQTLPGVQEPDYVLAAAGHAYRVAGQPEKALEVYRKGRSLYPDNAAFATGEIRCLIETGRIAEAAKLSKEVAVTPGKNQEQLTTVVEEARHVYAVQEAREGRYGEALDILSKLHETYPDDGRVTRDYLAVLAWSGDDAKAVTLYQSLPSGQQPDYVYDAVGKAYRNLKQPADAVAIYREALHYYPKNDNFQTGEVRGLMEDNRLDEAVARQKSGNSADQATQAMIVKSQLATAQEKAAQLARKGQYAESLTILRDLIRKNPKDNGVYQDYIAVLSWAGHDVEAVQAYESRKNMPQSDVVLGAVGHSYRSLKQFAKAYAVFQRGYKQSPDNQVFAVGLIGSLSDMKRYAEAQKMAEQDIDLHGNRVGVLVAGADAADANNDVYESLIYAEKALEIDPKNRAALHAEVRAADRMGAADVADELAARENVALTPRDISEIEGDKHAALVRWGKLEPTKEASRYKGSDKAIAILDQKIAALEQQPNARPGDLLRARFDRIVALRDRFRMQEVVNDYEKLRSEDVTVPSFALGPVGDAYLYLHQPEMARDVYLEALKTVPDDFEIRRQLFFAYVESDDFDNAYATIDKLRDDQPVWYYLKGNPERLPNPNRAMTEIDSGNARLYAGDYEQADEQLSGVAAKAPYDVHSKEALGTLYLTRGWPRQALQEFRLGTRAQDGRDVGTDTGAAMAALDMRDYPLAEADTQKLMRDYPESLDVQRQARQFDVYNMAELDVNSFMNLRSSGSAQGGNGYGFESTLYSAPVDYNWRIFAGTGYAHEEEPNGEGMVGFSRSRAGVEYRDPSLVATVAPTYNLYHGSERVGLDSAGEWTFNDQWTAGGGYELVSHDTPLRALNGGITANKASANVEWRQSEARSIRLDADNMAFSDGNNRWGADAAYSERLLTTPYWRVEGLVEASASHNSADATRNYFNPKLDFTGLTGARVTQTLYRRYETLYEHSLKVMPGIYWEHSYGARPAWTVDYEQTLHLNDTLEAGAGVGYTHQAYDGQSQNNVGFVIHLVEHF